VSENTEPTVKVLDLGIFSPNFRQIALPFSLNQVKPTSNQLFLAMVSILGHAPSLNTILESAYKACKGVIK
jgi:hypothetical protein